MWYAPLFFSHQFQFFSCKNRKNIKDSEFICIWMFGLESYIQKICNKVSFELVPVALSTDNNYFLFTSELWKDAFIAPFSFSSYHCHVHFRMTSTVHVTCICMNFKKWFVFKGYVESASFLFSFYEIIILSGPMYMNILLKMHHRCANF